MTGAGHRLFFANVHITKCGGSTFREVLERCFRAAYVETYSPIWEQPYTRDQMTEMILDRPGYACFSSHRLSLDLPFDEDRFRVVALAFVRDPIERVFSGFFYLGNLIRQGSPHREQHYAEWPIDDPEAFAQHVLEHEPFLLDGQFKFLTLGSKITTTEELGTLCAKDRVLLLPLERFDEALLVLGHLFPDRFVDLRYVPRNRTERYAPVPASASEKLMPHMSRDVEITRIANEQLDARIATLWPDRGAFERDRRALRGACRRFGLLHEWPRRILRRG